MIVGNNPTTAMAELQGPGIEPGKHAGNRAPITRMNTIPRVSPAGMVVAGPRADLNRHDSTGPCPHGTDQNGNGSDGMAAGSVRVLIRML